MHGRICKSPTPDTGLLGSLSVALADVENEGEARGYTVVNSTLQLGRQMDDVFNAFAVKSSNQR